MQGPVLLLVEDKSDDAFLFHRALKRARPDCRLAQVTSAAEAEDYLLGRNAYSDRAAHPFPEFIILNNAIALKSQRFLDWLRAHPACGVIPTIILSGSDDPRDTLDGYQSGAHTCFRKTGDLQDWDSLIHTIFDYWGRATVPPNAEKCAETA
jgi:two-component system, response regulator